MMRAAERGVDNILQWWRGRDQCTARFASIKAAIFLARRQMRGAPWIRYYQLRCTSPIAWLDAWATCTESQPGVDRATGFNCEHTRFSVSFLRHYKSLIPAFYVFSLLTGYAEAQPTSKLELVGCTTFVPQEGETIPPPSTFRNTQTFLSPAVAGRLAAYEDQDLTLIGPRGWSCEGSEGENGSVILIYPGKKRTVDGYEEVLFYSEGTDTSGDELNLSYAQTYFSDVVSKDYVKQYNMLNGTPPSFLNEIDRHKTDQLTYTSPYTLSFITSPGQDGLGVDVLSLIPPPRLKTDDNVPVFGFLALTTGQGDEKLVCDLTFFAAAIPKRYMELSSSINQVVKSLAPDDCSY